MARGALRRARGSARSAKIKDREKDRGETPKLANRKRRELVQVRRNDGRVHLDHHGDSACHYLMADHPINARASR